MLISIRNYEYDSILLIPFKIHFWSLVGKVTCLVTTSWVRWFRFYLWLKNMFLFPSRKIFTSFLCKILNTHWRTLELLPSKPTNNKHGRKRDWQVFERRNNNVYTIHRQQCVHSRETKMCSRGSSREGENTNILLWERLCRSIKRQD